MVAASNSRLTIMGRSILHCAASMQRNGLVGGVVADSKIPAEVNTAGALIDWVTSRLDSSDVFFGHGTDNSRDEAAALVYHVMQLDHDAGNRDYGIRASPQDVAEIQALLDARIGKCIPMPYLLNEAWFAGRNFYVDQRALIPRSPLAELIVAGFEPWLASKETGLALELGTGSGCIAVACALALPHWKIVATDISDSALEVARINIDRYDLSARVQLLKADMFAGVSGRFDLIVSNPPYVPAAESGDLPAEYAHEPPVALYSGPDGLDSARRILQDARNHLNDKGLLVLEVGEQRERLEAAFPLLPLTWPELDRGGQGIAVITAEDLAASLNDD